MKKLIFSSIMLVVFLTACTEKKQESKNPESQQTEKSAQPIHLTKAEFLTKVANFQANTTEWKYLGDKPCIIDFYATWCGPCKMVAPILDDLATEFDGQIYIYKVDVDAEPEIAAAYGIQSIPTIFFSPMTGNPQVSQGAMQKEDFQKIITGLLLKK
jgi:thioredoxin